jgi:hypothetical protein
MRACTGKPSAVSRAAIASLVSFALVGGSLTTTARAIAADKAACVASYESTQKLKKDGKLKAAHDEALTCAAAGCPSWVRDECAGWLVELDKSLPTIVASAQDGDGNDLEEVAVSVDGETVAKTLDGKPIAVDPGTHTLLFEWSNGRTVDKKLVIAAGERNRRVSVKFPKPGTNDAATADDGKKTGADTGDGTKKDDGGGDGASSDKPAEPSRPVPMTAWIFGGAGIVGLGTWAAFGLVGLGKKSDLDKCRPNCAVSDVDAAKQSFLLADVGLGVGVAALGTALVLYLTRPESKPAETPAVSFAPIRGGGFGSVSFAF